MMKSRRSYFFRKAAACAVAFLGFSAVATQATAQVSVSEVNTTTGTLSQSGTPCSGAMSRTFDITTSLTVTDVDLGLIIDHNTRGDVAAALVSPAGTNSLLFYRTGGSRNDYNMRLNQQSGTIMDQGSHATDNNVGAAPYQFTVRPDEAPGLDAFNGESGLGTWTLLVCDDSFFTDGTFLRGELFLTGTQDFADLEMDISASPMNPSYGGSSVLTYTVTNAQGDWTATGVNASVTLPSGLVYQGHSGAGSFNSGTGAWTIGTLAPGASAQLLVTVEVQSTGLYDASGEVTASNEPDPDSTPNNAGSNPFEDDSSSLTLAPGASGGGTPGVAPTLTCASPDMFDWDLNAWPGPATLSHTFVGGGSDGATFGFVYSGDTGFRDAGTAPATNTDFTGGYVPAEQSLYYWQNLPGTSESVTITSTLGVAGEGLSELQFELFDIDYASGQFRDSILIEGFLSGVSVSPVLTPGAVNSAFGSTVSGTGPADAVADDGNMTVTFLQPVDEVRITYANSEVTVSNPGVRNQAMSIRDFYYCPREYDFGDIQPSTFGAASHLIMAGFYIGTTAPDGEIATLTSVNADGDDTTGTADEGSITFPTLFEGGSGTLEVPVTGANGLLQVWIDFNGDGDFNDIVGGVSEQVATDFTIATDFGTASVPVTVPVGTVSTQTMARLRWSTTAAIGPSGVAGDGEVEDYAITITGAAILQGAKTNAIYDPGGLGLYSLPGNDIIYTITITNAGAGPTDTDSVFLVDVIPSEVEFWNGDIDAGGPDTYAGTDPVGFDQGDGSVLTIAYAADIAFATGATAPTTFGDCAAVTPDNTYRADLTFICFNPKGVLPAGDPDPWGSVSFRTRIK